MAEVCGWAQLNSGRSPQAFLSGVGSKTFWSLSAFLEYLSQCVSCAAFGYPCGLQLQSQEPEQLANTCNVLHTLLVQRQRDVSQRAQFDDHFQRMRSDLNVSEQTRDRLRSQLDAKQREHGTLLSQVGFIYLCMIRWL